MMKTYILYVIGIQLLIVQVSQCLVVESHVEQKIILSEAHDFEKVHSAEKLSYQINEIPVHEKGDAKTKYKLKVPVTLHLLKASPQKKVNNNVDASQARPKQNNANNNQNTVTTDKVTTLTTNSEETSNVTSATAIKDDDKILDRNADQKLDLDTYRATTEENEDADDYINLTCPSTIDYNNAEERKVTQIENNNLKKPTPDSENKYTTLKTKTEQEISNHTEKVMSTLLEVNDKKQAKNTRKYGYFFPLGYILLGNLTEPIKDRQSTTEMTTSTTSMKAKYVNWWFRHFKVNRKE